MSSVKDTAPAQDFLFVIKSYDHSTLDLCCEFDFTASYYTCKSLLQWIFFFFASGLETSYEVEVAYEIIKCSKAIMAGPFRHCKLTCVLWKIVTVLKGGGGGGRGE